MANPLGVIPPRPSKKSLCTEEKIKEQGDTLEDDGGNRSLTVDEYAISHHDGAPTSPVCRVSSSWPHYTSKKAGKITSAQASCPMSALARGMRSAPSKLQRDSGDVQDHGNIKVVTRIRPINHVERSMGGNECINIEENGTGYSVKVLQEVSKGLQYQSESPRTFYVTKEFPFDSCVAAEEDQAAVFEKCGVKELLESAFEGTNVTVFAYGQTGSGKTYTIHGTQGTEDCMPYDGIIPRALAYLFDRISSENQEITFGVSYCEIYNEAVYDLLLMRNTPLRLRWDSGEGFHAPDIHIQPCNTLEDAHAVLDYGNKRRKQRCHFLNAESSRSHAILTMYLHMEGTVPETPIMSKINFVDLAGSERLKESGLEDELSIKETANINKSLFLLGNVICALASGQPKHLVPYRESKLTKLLFGSMTTPAKCLMIACCSPRYE